ncbi:MULTISPECIES: ArsC family reductase [unclassified Rhizobium]|uniref:ArsC family reductase n=1 Tax=unclassified Rhizobium TaxID=2613769 RepID=UPI001A987B82|nr:MULTISPECIES: ArsC family reductase [unclassified Rhizobium]MBX5165766.1 ArsC family reductase [Rhizobium sp. NZLR4b]MBX5172123.1 ArsC family reductase [Rhizobium sp. NZLR1b]MBX5184532.1 ArsC family reductase [Rhizobium sp. NZLR5]MBX5191694.1 ArsC family reductase [Rhizobium sp. NZLR3b]MBX5196907.1 ArsC family reductase [Rhizobium sp. NZLR10]
MTVTIYGIKNCDTMKKARSWLEEHGVAYAFHDYKALGIDRAHLDAWIDQAGLDTVLNRAGTTFRKLADAERENLSWEKAIQLMLDQPSMIKRPVLEASGKLLIGFKPAIYACAFAG